MEITSPLVRRLQREAREDPERFWAAAAAGTPWFSPWSAVLDWRPPTFRWFVGATTNLSYNCLDRHVQRGWGGHAALIFENESGERRVYTYAHLLRMVERVAAALRGLGVGKGDRVAIYMPTCPEAIAAMLATTRIGAIHLVVFAGFGAGALADRIQMAGARAVFCADVTRRKGREVPLKEIVDQALEAGGGSVEHVVVLRRSEAEPREQSERRDGRDLTWDEFLRLGEGRSTSHEVMEANEPAYILATSGTTAKPKLVVHTHGPHQVYIRTMGEWVFGLRETDVWWSTSDIGWVVGHSYIVYAPLLAGCTTIAYEGALDHPGPETFYRIVDENRVTGIFTSPTAARLLMRYGADLAGRFDLSSVERVACAGEVLNPAAWEWLQREVFQDRVPVIDHMWQTETSGPIVGNPYGLGLLPIKPGSAGVLLPGVEGVVIGPEGEPLGPNEKGMFVVRRPFPGLTATLWGEPERYGPDYWERVPGQTLYFAGDAASIDEDGYVWFSGRADEIIKIAAHRIGTIEVESAFMRHPAVAEAGVCGRPDEVRGEVIAAFVVLKVGQSPSDGLRVELLQTVRRELGPVAVIGELSFVGTLPKTRSGKIMRRVLKAVALGREPGDISTIEDEGSVEEARASWDDLRAQVAARQTLARSGEQKA
ncbi:MAG TPA: acetate--CoA ligase [Chloroflexota bacterium]|jgi:acetyl-CoA synthetase|nr:acetate--CoA ligase [Chloroflexota bacterium]